jgi:hypothetical protein
LNPAAITAAKDLSQFALQMSAAGFHHHSSHQTHPFRSNPSGNLNLNNHNNIYSNNPQLAALAAYHYLPHFFDSQANPTGAQQQDLLVAAQQLNQAMMQNSQLAFLNNSNASKKRENDPTDRPISPNSSLNENAFVAKSPTVSNPTDCSTSPQRSNGSPQSVSPKSSQHPTEEVNGAKI